MVIQDRTISVALSQPPERRNPSESKSYLPVAKFKSQASNSSLVQLVFMFLQPKNLYFSVHFYISF
jgi:hypothetical protein